MLRPSFPLLLGGPLLLAVGAPAARAQDSTAGPAAAATTGRCANPDSIAVVGNSRVSESSIRSDAGLTAGAPLNFRQLQRAIKDLFATAQFDDVRLSCLDGGVGGRTTMVVTVKERPLLADVSVTGTDRVSARSVRDRVDLLAGRPVDPAQVVRAKTRIDSLYQASGYYLARVRPETTMVNGQVKLTFRIDEGRRLAVSGVRVNGNRVISDRQIVKAMQTKPEGFFWFRKGEFDEDKYAGDIAERIPGLFASLGFIDFAVVKDTLIVDRERGKALVDITVSEGPRYKVGSFEVTGNRRFNSEDIARFYPFADQGGRTLTERVMGFIRRRPAAPRGVFDRGRWETATGSVKTAYANEGYIYARVNPVVEREVAGTDSQHVVNLRWEINEDTPAIINRVDIAGNDYTSEACIRDQLVILPGDVFNQDRLIRSYQNIGNLNFFETPLPEPDVKPTDNGKDVDIVFRVKEKRTGNINFGASAGQGTGLGGFFGVDQPNVFGQCKRVSAQWQFGANINNFSLSYTDPAVRQSRISATTTAYRSQSRYNIANLGQQIVTGGSLQLGFPVRNSPFTRLYVSYGAEAIRFGRGGLLGDVRNTYPNSFRSTLGLTGTHDTRIDLPFATAGSMQTVNAQFNGGPLGGNANFQRYTTELRSYAPLGQLGGKRLGSQPIKFVFGLTARAGALFGNPGGFFSNQQFALGGVQYGEQLRGYDEFSITPEGYRTDANNTNATLQSFGSAFFTSTAEIGMRVNQAFYVNAFYDAGNIWRRPEEFDPSRLFRGAGIGLAVVSPLGPLGLDYAYGFDRREAVVVNGQATTRPAPKWQLHFKLGQLF